MTSPISSDDLRAEELRLRYKEMLGDPSVFPTRANWQYITEHRMHGLATSLYGRYLAAATVGEIDASELHQIALEEFPAFITAIDRAEAVEAVYSDIDSAPAATASLIRQCKLFDAQALSRLIDLGNISFAMDIADTYQPQYTASDLLNMQRLVQKIDNLPENGYIQERPGMFGTSKRFICPNGHSNPADAKYCTHSECRQNARGLTAEQEAAAATLRSRTIALKNLIK